MPDTPAVSEDVASVDAIVAAIYEAVSFEPNGMADWERLASLFHPDGRLIPPSGDESELRPVLSVEEFVQRSTEYAEEIGIRERPEAPIPDDFER